MMKFLFLILFIIWGKKEHLEQLWHCRQALLQPGIWKRLIKMNLCNLGELQMEDKEKKQMLTTELTKEKSGRSAGMNSGYIQ